MTTSATTDNFDAYEWTLTHKLETVEEELRGVAEDITRIGVKVQTALDEDLRLNELGELQSRGPRLDALIGQRQMLIDAIRQYRYQTERGSQD